MRFNGKPDLTIRYIFMLGYEAGWQDRKTLIFQQIYRGMSPLGESDG